MISCVSSAYCIIVLSGAWMLRSFVNKVYSRGPRAEPWKTPIVFNRTGAVGECDALGVTWQICLKPVCVDAQGFQFSNQPVVVNYVKRLTHVK